MLLDDSVRAAKKATAVGGLATCEIWKKVPHVFQGLEFLPESRQAIHHIVEFVHLHTNWPR
jgi:acetyl esterase/lipase